MLRKISLPDTRLNCYLQANIFNAKNNIKTLYIKKKIYQFQALKINMITDISIMIVAAAEDNDLSSVVRNLNSYTTHAENQNGNQSVKEKPGQVRLTIYPKIVVKLMS